MNHPTDNLVRAFIAPTAAILRAEPDQEGDGRTLYGHFSVFNRWTEIDDWHEGRFLERIAPGAFKRTFRDRRDQIKVLFDHGHDPQLGNKPLGQIIDLREDETGAYYEVRLLEVPYNRDFVIPAARAGLLGASFRFRVTGEKWVEPKEASEENPAKLPERTITDVDLYEFGPVTFPAYAEASAGVRAQTGEFLDRLMNDPRFVARFTERVGLKVVEPLLDAVPASPPASDPAPTPEVAADTTTARSDEMQPSAPSSPLSKDERKKVARQIVADRMGPRKQ